MSKPSKPRPLSVEQLVQRLQEDNAELVRQRDAYQQRCVGLMQQAVVNCAMGMFIRAIQNSPTDDPAVLAQACLETSVKFVRACDEFLPQMDEVKEQFAKNDVADKPADSTAH